MEFRPFVASDRPGVLCEQEHWPSFLEDPARANRALTAAGATAIVAFKGEAVVGLSNCRAMARFKLTCR